jgi:hypothetical protein
VTPPEKCGDKLILMGFSEGKYYNAQSMLRKKTPAALKLLAGKIGSRFDVR